MIVSTRLSQYKNTIGQVLKIMRCPIQSLFIYTYMLYTEIKAYLTISLIDIYLCTAFVVIRLQSITLAYVWLVDHGGS